MLVTLHTLHVKQGTTSWTSFQSQAGSTLGTQTLYVQLFNNDLLFFLNKIRKDITAYKGP